MKLDLNVCWDHHMFHKESRSIPSGKLDLVEKDRFVN